VSEGAALLARARRSGVNATVGMIIFLGTVAMLFAALFFAYAVMRAQAPAWPPPEQPLLPRGLLAMNTLLLLGGSLGLRLALAAAHRDEPRAARRRALGALVLGGAFLAAQIVVWRGLTAAGAGPASGIYGSVFFALSGFHGLHVLGGLAALAAILGTAGRAPPASFSRRLGLAALYWDFVLIVWMIFYLTVCVL
jgi:cytochrome c oxidase subunit III